MGQQVHWQYVLVWAPECNPPTFTLYRQSNQGHRYNWAQVPGPELLGLAGVDRVLEEFYAGLLALMEATV